MLSPPVIKETCLDVADLARAACFYRELFGFERIEGDDRFCALSVAGQHVLLLFLRGATPRPVRTPGGMIPPHGTSGVSHIGFAVSKETLPQWETRLREQRVAIESSVTWPLGGTSLYFYDPDGHLIELLTPGTWPIY
jgi:catechol 2,3-dioxygenase-like lactoylglutathione lyase family enzyme